MLETPRGQAIVDNEVRQQQEHRLFAENAVRMMRRDDDRWEKLLEGIGVLVATPHPSTNRKPTTESEEELVEFPQFEILIRGAYSGAEDFDFEALHCQSMWNLLVAQYVLRTVCYCTALHCGVSAQ